MVRSEPPARPSVAPPHRLGQRQPVARELVDEAVEAGEGGPPGGALHEAVVAGPDVGDHGGEVDPQVGEEPAPQRPQRRLQVGQRAVVRPPARLDIALGVAVARVGGAEPCRPGLRLAGLLHGRLDGRLHKGGGARHTAPYTLRCRHAQRGVVRVAAQAGGAAGPVVALPGTREVQVMPGSSGLRRASEEEHGGGGGHRQEGQRERRSPRSSTHLLVELSGRRWGSGGGSGSGELPFLLGGAGEGLRRRWPSSVK